MVSSLYLSEPLTCSAASRAFAHSASYFIAFGKSSVSISVTSPSTISSAAAAVSLAASSASSAVQVIGNYMRIYVRKEVTVTNRNDTNAKIKHLPAVVAASAEAAAASTPSAATSAAFAATSAAVAVRLREEKKY